jgi:hypothetical protein
MRHARSQPHVQPEVEAMSPVVHARRRDIGAVLLG